MRIVETTPDQNAAVVAVLGVVATARGETPPSEADEAVIGAAARHLLGATVEVADLPTDLPDDVAITLDGTDVSELAMSIAAILCLADITKKADGKQAPFEPARVEALRDVAQSLQVDDDDVDELYQLTTYHRARVTFDLFRRYLASNYGEHLPMLRVTLEQAGAAVGVDRDEHEARWRVMERLGDGSVGAELVRYYHEHNWPYPGTNRHQPLEFAEHDFHHVLGGYATTPAGELQAGAFTAGVAGRPFDGARFLLLWEQLGVLSRAIPGAVEAFDADSFFAALERGTRTTQDFVGADWDPWSIVNRDLDEMRDAYRIGSGGQLAPGDPYDRDPPLIRAAQA